MTIMEVIVNKDYWYTFVIVNAPKYLLIVNSSTCGSVMASI